MDYKPEINLMPIRPAQPARSSSNFYFRTSVWKSKASDLLQKKNLTDEYGLTTSIDFRDKYELIALPEDQC